MSTTTEVKPPVQLTTGAIAELTKVLANNTDTTKPYIRVGVKGGGCSGMTYVLGIDAMEADDTLYNIEGIPVIMKHAHELYLTGIEVDWQTGLNSRGFTFANPNASSTCGCGSSFAV
jgi:iron-sulfur cluster assembly accessory protein